MTHCKICPEPALVCVKYVFVSHRHELAALTQTITLISVSLGSECVSMTYYGACDTLISDKISLSVVYPRCVIVAGPPHPERWEGT